MAYNEKVAAFFHLAFNGATALTRMTDHEIEPVFVPHRPKFNRKFRMTTGAIYWKFPDGPNGEKRGLKLTTTDFFGPEYKYFLGVNGDLDVKGRPVKSWEVAVPIVEELAAKMKAKYTQFYIANDTQNNKKDVQ